MGTITSWGAAIVTSITSALGLLFSFVPKLLGFLAILIIGLIVSALLEKGVTLLLRKAGFDNFAHRIGLTRLEQRTNINLNPSVVLGKIVYWFVLLIFLIPAINSLGLTTISNILTQIIAYIPNVFVAVLILFLGTLAGTFVADIIKGATGAARMGSPNVLANIARFAIIAFAAIIALEQLQIAPSILNILFTAVVGALALAFGLAFGLGGRETAQRWLARGENQLSNTSQMGTAPATPPNMNQGRTEQPRNREYA
ncbi:mechanosensitive ion channel family protein [Ktedonosporobacter rubrisoli]|nr:small-conductance mechanosensitive ion channel [Ktedonosporobacter rubrisoli]